MKSLRLVLVATAVLGIAGAIFVAAVVSSGGQRRAAQASAVQADPRPDDVSTATLPEGLVTLRVDFKSQGKAGTKEPTTWDGRLSVSQGRIRQLRLWRDDPRDRVEGTGWQLSTHRSVSWFRSQRRPGRTSPPQDAALVVELTEATPQTELKFETALSEK